MGEEKKKFFRRPTAAEILNSTENIEIKRDIWEHILELRKDQSITILGNIFPYGFTDSKDFLKNGPVVTVPTIDRENPLLLPYEIREKTFNSLPKHRIRYAGFVFTPHAGLDRTPRLVRWNDVLEAAKMIAYAPISGEKILFKPTTEITEVYTPLSRTTEKGASIVAKVPSRTRKKPKYTIRGDHIPVNDGKEKYSIAYMFRTDHVCEDKRHYLRFPKKKSPRPQEEYLIDAHESFFYLATIAHFINLAREEEKETGKRPKIIPLEMNIIGIPTNMMCEAYDTLINRTLIKVSQDSKPITPREGHLEALIWEGIIKEGYRKCFFREWEGSLNNFKWTTYSKSTYPALKGAVCWCS